MVEFDLTSGHDFEARLEMYAWLIENAKGFEITTLNNVMVGSVKLNEQDAVIFKLRFGL